jgi:hypothetical protein
MLISIMKSELESIVCASIGAAYIKRPPAKHVLR